MLADRSCREEFLPGCLFGEAAWDAMLVLYSEEPGLPHCAETLSQRLDLPSTTMARWVTVLENEGLIESRPLSLLQERETVRLSAMGTDALQAYLRAALLKI